MKSEYISFPFQLPEGCVVQLPQPSKDGLIYFDFRIDQKWDGVLVANSDGECVGYYFSRKVVDNPIKLLPEKIEAIRPPCFWHRIYTALPLAWLDFITLNLLNVWGLCPAFFIAARFWADVLYLPVVLLSILSLIAMNRHGGYFFMRLPIAATAVTWLLVIGLQLLR